MCLLVYIESFVYLIFKYFCFIKKYSIMKKKEFVYYNFVVINYFIYYCKKNINNI